jgi:hypothetical protein
MTTLIMVVYARQKIVDNTMVKRQDPFLTSVSVISFSVSPTAMTLITHVSRDYWWSRIQVISLMLTRRNLVVAEVTFNRQQTFSSVQRAATIQVSRANIFWRVQVRRSASYAVPPPLAPLLLSRYTERID